MTGMWNEISYSVDTNQVIISAPGPQGPPGPYAASVQYATNAASVVSVSGIPTRWYGSFYDTTTQTTASANNPTAMRCNSSDSASTTGVRINSSSIIFDHAGEYNIQFSAQVYEASNNVNINVWLRKNGQDISWTNTRLTPSSQNPYIVAAWNFLVPASQNDFYQLMWCSSDSTTVLFSTASTSYCPATPSVIITAVQV